MIFNIRRFLKNHSDFLFIALLSVVTILFNKELLDDTQPIRFFGLGILCSLLNLILLLSSSFKLKNPLFLGLLLINLVLSISFSLNAILWSEAFYEFSKLFFQLNIILIGFQVFQKTYHFSKTELNSKRYFFYLLFTFQAVVLVGVFFSIYQKGFDLVLNGTKPYGGFFINPNLNSQVLLIGCLFLCYSLTLLTQSKLKFLCVSLIVSSIIALWLLGSLTALIAFIVNAILFLYFKLSRKYKRFFIISSLIAIVLSSFLIGIKGLDNILERNSVIQRKALWNSSLEMIKERPLKGHGISNWRLLYLQYIKGDQAKNVLQNSSGSILFNKPHNDYLWVLTEGGIFLLLITILIDFFSLSYCYLKLKHSRGLKQLLFLIIFLALTDYIIFKLFSYPKDRIEHLIIHSLLLAILLTFDNRSRSFKLSKSFRLLLLLCLLLISVTISFFGFKRLQSEWHMNKVIINQKVSQFQQVTNHAQKAYSNYYQISSIGTPVKWFEGLGKMHLGLHEQAHQRFLSAYQAHPNHLHVLNNLGTTYSIQNQIDSALFFYNSALKLNPKFNESRMNLSAIYFNQRKYDQAFEEIKKIPLTYTNQSFPFYANKIIHRSIGQQFDSLMIKNGFLFSINPNADSPVNPYFFFYKVSINQQVSMLRFTDFIIQSYKANIIQLNIIAGNLY